MQDGQRQYPVNIFVLHHSTGPDFPDTPDITIQDWFSTIGKDRGYGGGSIYPYHEHPSRPGQVTYSMAQFAGAPDSSNKYGYKLIDLMVSPWQNVAWHCGDWNTNVHSVGLENCGNFTNKVLPQKALMAIADWLRPVDEELMEAGYPTGLSIMLHQEIFNTACPARIAEQRDTLVDMINNPAKWNNILWPPVTPPPAPVVTTIEEVKTETIPFPIKTIEDNAKPYGSVEVTTVGRNGVRTSIFTVTLTDGKETSRVLKNTSITTAPVTQVTTVGTYVKPPTDGPTDYDKEQDSKLSAFISVMAEFFAAVGKAITSVISSIGGK